MAISKPLPLSALFINHAADILADTATGLRGAEIVRALGAYAIEFDVAIPHPTYPFDAPNKRTALSENLMAFPDEQRYRIIRDLCDHPSMQVRNPDAARKLKLVLISRYGHLDPGGLGAEVNQELIDQTRHWLNMCPGALNLFTGALEKYKSGILARNLLDDLRLALEKLVQTCSGTRNPLRTRWPGSEHS